jgi:hypothetical protein
MTLQVAGGVLTGAVLGVLILWAYRWVRSQSRLIAAVMAAGIICRSLVGMLLFWTSYLHLSFFDELQTGNGFWTVAPDARYYYNMAVALARSDGTLVLHGVASRPFVRVLAAWMRFVGVSPASALFLHVSLYVLLCVIVVRIARPRGAWQGSLPAAVCLLPFSLCPAVLINGSQSLKDDAFGFVLAVASIAVVRLLRVSSRAGSRRPAVQSTIGSLAAFVFMVWLIALVREYVAFIMWFSLVPAVAVYAWLSRRAGARRTVAFVVVVLVAVAMSHGLGSGALIWSRLQYPATNAAGADASAARQDDDPLAARGILRTVTEMIEPVLWQIRHQRMRFRQAGGDTNLAPPVGSGQGGVRATLVGFAAIFAPISIVRAAGLVHFEGGRGLLFVTDADALFLDLSILAVFALLVSRRGSLRCAAPYVCYSICLALVTSLLLAYVVTNFGTLFRLRLMVAVPLWMLPLAVGCNRDPDSAFPDARQCAG